MRISMELDNGYLPDAYGKHAAREDCCGWSCRRSFPFTVEDIPNDTQAIALLFIDWDSVPVCGFPWIHWCAFVSGPFGDDLEVPDDVSRKQCARLRQGYNSAAKSEPERGTGYVGPCPPDCDHVYLLKVAALDDDICLPEPFWANELVKACEDHIIETASIKLPSRC